MGPTGIAPTLPRPSAIFSHAGLQADRQRAVTSRGCSDGPGINRHRAGSWADLMTVVNGPTGVAPTLPRPPAIKCHAGLQVGGRHGATSRGCGDGPGINRRRTGSWVDLMTVVIGRRTGVAPTLPRPPAIKSHAGLQADRRRAVTSYSCSDGSGIIRHRAGSWADLMTVVNGPDWNRAHATAPARH
jgi:hypothetical protein